MNLEDKRELEEFCDARYVRKDDCTERRENFDKKLAKDDKRIEIVERKFNTVERILWILVSEAAAALVVLLINMIFK